MIVFFDWDRSDITAEAATTLDATITTLRDCGNPAVTLDGYTDRSGTDAYNRCLVGAARRRGAGLSRRKAFLNSTVSTQGFGETKLRVPTADGVRELQNRRVEITVK